ncbi:MAG TPA: hypothetical protein VHU83_21825 [Bryobacteraceae bacterium]|nr:hypothetical protein [Bryobacteraceae bacterium]
MSTPNPRNRVVVFRLTEEEYRSLKEACSAAGRRNLSDYTRSELLLALRADGAEMAIQRRFQEIDHKLRDLSHLLKEVFEYLHIGSNVEVSQELCVEQES